jgi:hypothetical protein
MPQKYSAAFEVWWNENKNSETLIDSYNNYKQDTACTDDTPMSFKQWAVGAWQED